MTINGFLFHEDIRMQTLLSDFTLTGLAKLLTILCAC